LLMTLLFHPKGVFVVFCRWSQMPKAPERKQ
jgi:hypothetical protein